MGKYYLAIDIGASSGRHIIAEKKNGKIVLEEIYRFSNGMEENDGSLCWNLDNLFSEIIAGLKKCKEIDKVPSYMGIDTWAVDYVLLDKDDNILGKTYGYRDNRNIGMDEEVYKVITKEDLYKRTGIQKLVFNTIFQLMSDKKNHPENLEKAETMLLIPDYFNYLLTGVKKAEYTNATTTQLVSPKTKDWDYELIEKLGFNLKIFMPIEKPGTLVGRFKEEIKNEIGFDCEVVLPATHDTGSAVAAVPFEEDGKVFISSGTWSLMGMERFDPDCSTESMKCNFTNEGGYDYRFRYLKNIMGLWMIQSVKKEWKEDLSFVEICKQASESTIDSIVDCDDDSFFAPKSMIEAVKAYCRKTNQQVPNTLGEIASVIYNSLAISYKNVVELLEKLTGEKFDSINIVGGGANADYLNKLTAKYSGKKVFAGPAEATAIGNIIVQMLYAEEFDNLQEARKCIHDSFDIKYYNN